jgi:hypothetical protein
MYIQGFKLQTAESFLDRLEAKSKPPKPHGSKEFKA